MIKKLVLLLLFKANLVFAAPDIKQLLDKMQVSASTNNYQATLVLHEGENIYSLLVEHRAGSGTQREFERLVSLQGAKQEMIVDGARMLVLLPNGKHDFVLRNPLADTFLNLHNSLEKYQINLSGEDRVAGRKAYVLDIKAKDNYHYSYRLWLDKVSGLYLRAKWLADDNKLKSEALFTSIKFAGPDVKNHQAYANSNPPSATMRLNAKKLKNPKLKIGWLPKDFVLLDKFSHPVEGAIPTEQLVFGDGMVKVSVYVDEAKKSPVTGFLDMGRTSCFGRKLNGKHITVLGEMPPATVKRIAESIESK